MVNKYSGNGKGLKIWNRVQVHLEQMNIPYQLEFTTNAQEANEVVIKLISMKSIRALIVIGGDGTVQSVLQELINHDLPLGIIPAGSGNDFARGLKVPRNLEKALKYILAGKTKKIDILEVGKQYCMTIVGIGLDGEVARSSNQSNYKRWFNKIKAGQLAFVLGFFIELFRYKPRTLEIIIDGNPYTFHKVWLIAAANFSYYGGGMKVCPQADCSDGLMDICIVSGISRLKLLLLFPKVFKGSHIHHPAVTLLQGENLIVSGNKPITIHGDGEILGQTPIEIRLQKHALRVIYNEYF